MDEKEILASLNQVYSHLEGVQPLIEKNDWEGVNTLLLQVQVIKDKIRNNNPKVETLISQSPSFNADYQPLKTAIMVKSAAIITIIEDWKQKHVSKISESKNVINNISKYYNPSNTSFYIDKNE